MRLPILIGVVILGIVLAGALLAPQFRSAAEKANEQALTEATLAQRLLHRYDVRLPGLARRAEPETLKTADLEAIAQEARERLEALRKQATQTLGRIRSEATAEGLPAPEMQVPGAHAAGLQRAVRGYEQLLRDNADLLKQALQHAKAASGAANPLGVAQVAGMVEYARAAGLFAEAQLLRLRQAAVLERMLALAAEGGAQRAREAFLAGLDVTEIVAQLRADLDELRSLHETAVERAGALAAEVAAREAELEQITQALAQARDERFALEQRGFVAGDDASFEAYRQQFLDITERLRTLQEREQLLRFGGRQEARFEGDDMLTATISGGEALVGLETLRAQATAAEDQAQRLAAGLKAIEEHVGFLTAAGKSAAEGAQRHAALRGQLEAQADDLRPQLEELIQAATAKEDAALKAARAAVRAFRSSQQAADQWVRQAQETQRDKDPERANPRLRMMVAETAIPRVGVSAEIEARLLIGRICLQRVEASERLIEDMRLLDEMRSDAGFDATPFEEQIAAAVEEGLKELEAAEKACQKLIQKSPQESKWITQAALATVYHLLARLDPAQAPVYFANALEQVETATAGREAFPYAGTHVRFREHLRALLGSGAVPEAEPGTEAGAETGEPAPGEGETPPEGGD